MHLRWYTSGYVRLPCLLQCASPASRRSLPKIWSSSRTYVCTRFQLQQQSALTDAASHHDGIPDVVGSTTDAASSASHTITATERSRLGQLALTFRLLKEISGRATAAGETGDGASTGRLLGQAIGLSPGPPHTPINASLKQLYSNTPIETVLRELQDVCKYRNKKSVTIETQSEIDLLSKLHILDSPSKHILSSADILPKSESMKERKKRLQQEKQFEQREIVRKKSAAVSIATDTKVVDSPSTRHGNSRSSPPLSPYPPFPAAAAPSDSLDQAKPPRSKSAIPNYISALTQEEPAAERPQANSSTSPVKASLPPPQARIVDTSFISYRNIETAEAPNVPQLSFDLSRVLFNPGVYHLQDPRSRVYNFDPYLQKIMPVTEFNFAALNPYTTSSEDAFLQDVAKKEKKRYVGSTSSLSGAMSQFHFLLSGWRPIDSTVMSQKITAVSDFTQITKAPASIFLRCKGGVYAVDADKEYDTPNVLMMQGKSMEKLLTLEKEDFEKYRKPKAGGDAPAIKPEPEGFHYSTVENFLLRSQLDAYDPRLPGTGMFDLKTRSVAGIRMNLSEHEIGMGYEIKERFGLWESYEREYHDMIRAAFLKYSLQVRMGRMDGIFVAYHNIKRIFGFQYVPLAELDMALHGQADPTLGDREYRMSLKLMNDIFNQATLECPGQSFRFMFATNEAPKNSSDIEPTSHGSSATRMKIVAETVTDEEIEEIQQPAKKKMDEYEQSMAEGIDPSKASQTMEEMFGSQASPSTLESTAADSSVLDDMLQWTFEEAVTQTTKADSPVPKKASSSSNTKKKKYLSWTLRTWHEVDGKFVVRPANLSSTCRWNVHYTLERTDQNAQDHLTNIKSVRASLMAYDKISDSSYFRSMMRQMSQSGRLWRAEQDMKDSGRERVVLYNTSKPDP